MSKNPFDILTSVLKVFSNGLELIQENLPTTLSVYSIILLIIVIIFNITYLAKAFDTSSDSTYCNNSFISSVINTITWTVIVSTIIISLTVMKQFADVILSKDIILTYGKILGDIFYNFCIIGFIYLLSGFIFSFANNILSNKNNYNIESLLTWIWIPVSILLGLIMMGGLISFFRRKYGDYEKIFSRFNKYLSPFLITISLFSIITLITGTNIYYASIISAELFGIIFILLFIGLLVAMILLFIVPYRVEGIEALNKYITEITTKRENIMKGTNQLLDQLSQTRSIRKFSIL
tara:strand:- start:417 stop:1295 length:879 start_codon:yes stop_codon:yes gene_type:complete